MTGIMSFARRMSALRVLAASLVLLGVLLRAVVPQGFMPVAAGAEALVRIEICTASGLADIFVPTGEAPQTSHHDEAPHDPCPYATAFAQALFTSFASLAPLPLPAYSASCAARLPVSTCARPYEAQAPPSLRV